MQSLTEALNGVLAYLKKWNMPVVEHLNNGSADAHIRTQFEATECTPTKELVELFEWRNGTSFDGKATLGQISFIPGYHLLSLEDALRCYQDYRDDERWQASWIPFMANGGGDFYIADLSKGSLEQSPVVGFIIGEPTHDIEYESVQSMMVTFHQCFADGAIFKNEKGSLDESDEKQILIARKNNPSIEFWKNAS